GSAVAGSAHQSLAVGRDQVHAALAGGAGRSNRASLGGNAGNAGPFHGDGGQAGPSHGPDAWHAYAGTNGGAAQGEGRRVRSFIFDRDDSAPRRRSDHGERFVRLPRLMPHSQRVLTADTSP